MDVKSVGYKPAFTGYVDKSVIKLVDKAVKYGIEGTARHSKEKVSIESLQQIVERGNKIKETFNDIVKDAHPKTRLCVIDSQVGLFRRQRRYQFNLGNSALKCSTDNKKQALEIYWFDDKSFPLDIMENLGKFSENLKTSVNAKEVDSELFKAFLNKLYAAAQEPASKISRWFNNRKALKAQKLAEEFGADANVIAKDYNAACEAAKLSKDNQNLGKTFLKELGKK